jgi:HK97 family phage prohead protease
MDYGVKNFSLPIALKDVDTKQGIVTGYFAAFDIVDSDGDSIRKGAFAKSIAERGPGTLGFNIKHLLDHNTTKAVGTLQLLKEDNHGLYYESKAGRHSLGRDFLMMCEDGLITEHSIGFRWVQGKSERLANGTMLRHEVNLKEGSSLQCWGANRHTPLVGVKAEGLGAEERATMLSEATSRLAKLTKALKGAYSDDLCELLELQALQLESLCKSLIADPTTSLPAEEEPAAKATSAPVIEPTDGELVKLFKSSLNLN